VSVLLLSPVGWAVRGMSLPVPTPAETDLAPHVQQVAAYLTGILETTVPAAAQPGSWVTIRMTTCAVHRLEQPDAVWLYQEQASTDTLAQPYRQRFLNIVASPYSQTVKSLSFKPVNPKQWVNFCDRAAGDRRILARDLGTLVCSVFLKPQHDAAGAPLYQGNTPADGCPANVRGAVRIRNHIRLYRTGMETWDRGFDAQGQQVWGAKTEAYRYRKIP
jgi:CpeT/CpcT family (DUF1001)